MKEQKEQKWTTYEGLTSDQPEANKLGFVIPTEFYTAHNKGEYHGFLKGLDSLWDVKFNFDHHLERASRKIVRQADEFYRRQTNPDLSLEMKGQLNELIKTMVEYKTSVYELNLNNGGNDQNDNNTRGIQALAEKLKTAGNKLATKFEQDLLDLLEQTERRARTRNKVVLVLSIIAEIVGWSLFVASLIVNPLLFVTLFIPAMILMIAPFPLGGICGISLALNDNEDNIKPHAIRSMTADFADAGVKADKEQELTPTCPKESTPTCPKELTPTCPSPNFFSTQGNMSNSEEKSDDNDTTVSASNLRVV